MASINITHTSDNPEPRPILHITKEYKQQYLILLTIEHSCNLKLHTTSIGHNKQPNSYKFQQ